MFKKFLLTFFTFLIVFVSSLSFFVRQTHAQTYWWNPPFQEFYNKVNSVEANPPQEIFGERYTAAQVSWIMWSLLMFAMNNTVDSNMSTCILAGGSFTGCHEQYPTWTKPVGFNPTEKKDSEGVFATFFPTNRSVSFVNYSRDKLADFNILPQVSEAQAQGFGFTALNPVQKISVVFRDIGFGFAVIYALILAFMAMFRAQLDAKTVVTAMSAIPRLIITIVLMAFAYAIAGFLIDLMYVGIGLVALVFQQTGILQDASGNSVPWADYFRILTDGPESIGGGLIGWMVVLVPIIVTGVLSLFWGQSGFLNGLGVDARVFQILATVLALIFIVWALIIAAKSLLTLIKAYISIIVATVFGSLQIGLGIISPSAGFRPWFFGLVGNLAVYITTGVCCISSLFFVAAAFPNGAPGIADALVSGATISSPFACDPNVTTCRFWYPPLTLGTQTATFDPLPFLFLIAGLYILSLIPQAGSIAQSLIAGKGLAGGIDPRANGLAGLTAPFAAAGGYIAGGAQDAARRYLAARELKRFEFFEGNKMKRAAQVGKPYDPSASTIARKSRIESKLK